MIAQRLELEAQDDDEFFPRIHGFDLGGALVGQLAGAAGEYLDVHIGGGERHAW